jgi:hypothetical protein
MQNSNLTALAALRNLRGKVGTEVRPTGKPIWGQQKSLIEVPDHFLVIGPDTDRSSALNNDTNVPATIHR